MFRLPTCAVWSQTAEFERRGSDLRGPQVAVGQGGGAGQARQVAGLEPLQDHAGLLDESARVTVQMAATDEPLLQRVEPLLPSSNLRIAGESVLQEVERAAGPHEASYLRQSRERVGDRAQREGAQRAVVRRVVGRD